MLSLRRPGPYRHEAVPLELALSELDSIPELDPGRVLAVTLSAQGSGEEEQRLRDWGFRRFPAGVADLIDLGTWESANAFVSGAIPKNRERRKIRGALATFTQGGGRAWVLPRPHVSPELLAAFQTDVVLRATAIGEMRPYVAVDATSSQSLSQPNMHFLGLEVEGRLVGGALLHVSNWRSLLWGGCATGAAADQRVRWTRELDPDASIVEMLIAHHDPSLADSRLADALPWVLYWNLIDWAIQHGAAVLSIGQGFRILRGRYLGVQKYKRQWTSSAIAFWSQSTKHFIRSSPAAYLGARENAVELYLDDAGEPVQRFVLCGSPETDDTVKALLTSDSHFHKEVLTLTQPSQRALAEFLAQRSVSADVGLWDGT